MARPQKTGEELIAVTLRLPRAFINRVDEISKMTGVSRSDIIRPRIDTRSDSSIIVTNIPAPSKRQRLSKASAADPKLLMQLAAIGNNLNQIARGINADALAGKSFEKISILICLESIERQIKRLVSSQDKNVD